jgi:DNA-binding response OmpR family regulator
MREKILIIDAEKEFAHRGKKGIRAALKESPDIILLDAMMPRLDGFEILKRLKRNEKTYHIPVIMLTAKSTDESKIIASGLSVDDTIVKPIEAKALRTKIRSVLSQEL